MLAVSLSGLEISFKERSLACLLVPALTGSPVEDRRLTVELPKFGPRTLLMSARLISPRCPRVERILVSFDDVTKTHAKATALAAAKEEAERANLQSRAFSPP